MGERWQKWLSPFYYEVNCGAVVAHETSQVIVVVFKRRSNSAHPWRLPKILLWSNNFRLSLMPAKMARHSAILTLIGVLALTQLSTTEDVIWYQKSSDYLTKHQLAWQGTTDGKTPPDLLIASVIVQPWLLAVSQSKNIIYWVDKSGVIGAW